MHEAYSDGFHGRRDSSKDRVILIYWPLAVRLQDWERREVKVLSNLYVLGARSDGCLELPGRGDDGDVRCV